MSRSFRWLARILVALVLMALTASAGVALWLDRKLADPRLAGEVAARLSEAIGADVRIESLDFLWPGWIEIEGASVRLDGDPADHPMLEVPSIQVLISPTSLLDRRLHCPIVQIAGPRFAFHLRADGSFALPRKPARVDAGGSRTGTAAGPMAQRPPDGPGDQWLAAIDRYAVSDATLMLSEADGSRSFLAEGVALQGHFDVGGSRAGGSARVSSARVVLKNGTAIEDFRAALTLTNGATRMTDVRAMIDGASARGELSTEQKDGAQGFHFSAKVTNVQRRHLQKFFSLPDYLTFDEADATVRGEGDIENPEKIAASGALVCRDTRLAANQLLRHTGIKATFGGWDSIRFGDTTANLAYSNRWFRIADIATDPTRTVASGSGHVAFGPAGEGEAHLAGALPLCGGMADVTFRYRGDAASMPFSAGIALQRVGLREFLAPFDIRVASARNAPKLETYLQGRLAGDIAFTGDLRAPGAIGNGNASIDSLTVALERLLRDLGVPADLPDIRSVSFGAVAGGLSVTNGALRITRLRSAGRNTPARIEASLASGPDGLAEALIALDLPIWKGRVNARIEQKRALGDRRPFAVSLRGADLDTPGVLRSFRLNPGSLEGRTTIDFSGGGDVRALDRLQGKGSLAIRPARIRGIKTLNILASLLAMPGLGSFNLDSLEADYRIANRTATFTEIRTAPPSRDHFTARGTLGFDGATDFKGTLVVNSGAPGFVGNTLYALGLKANRGIIQVPFSITGNTRNPRVKIDAPGLAGSAASGVIDNIPLINRLPGLFRKREPKPAETDPQQDGSRKR